MSQEDIARAVGGVVKAASDIQRTRVEAGTAAEVQVLIDERDGAGAFRMRRFIMGDGGGMPRHTNRVEHEQYVLAGRARVGVGETVHEVAAGDVLYIPSGTPHYYEVVEAPFEFLCMVPAREDEIEMVESGSREMP